VNGTVRSAVCYRSYHPIFGGLRGSNLQEISKVIQSGLATHPVKLSRQRGGVSGDLYLAFHRSLHHEDKAREARRWLRGQELRPYFVGATIGAFATLAAAIVAALVGVWFK
jgi:hypothetical protein